MKLTPYKIVITTIEEVFSRIGRQLGVVGEQELKDWVKHKLDNSGAIIENYHMILKGEDENQISVADNGELIIGSFWVFTLRCSKNEEDGEVLTYWTLQTFTELKEVKEYYKSELENNHDFVECLVFFDGEPLGCEIDAEYIDKALTDEIYEQIKVKSIYFDIYEIIRIAGSEFFYYYRKIEDVEESLIEFFNKEEKGLIFTSTKVYKGNKEIPYIYNKEDSKIIWL